MEPGQGKTCSPERAVANCGLGVGGLQGLLPCTRGYAASPRGKDSQLPIADCHRAIHKFAASITNSLVTIYKIYRYCIVIDFMGVVACRAALHGAGCVSLRGMMS